MATREKKATVARGLLLLLCAGAIVGGLGLVWVANHPTETTACTLGAPIDKIGGATPEDARTRWAAQFDLGIDIDRPDELSGSGDRRAAIYLLDGPDRGPTDPSRTYYQQVVVERGGDDVWRVVDANECARWAA